MVTADERAVRCVSYYISILGSDHNIHRQARCKILFNINKHVLLNKYIK